jgi:hypothetical protein
MIRAASKAVTLVLDSVTVLDTIKSLSHAKRSVARVVTRQNRSYKENNDSALKK